MVGRATSGSGSASEEPSPPRATAFTAELLPEAIPLGLGAAQLACQALGALGLRGIRLRRLLTAGITRWIEALEDALGEKVGSRVRDYELQDPPHPPCHRYEDREHEAFPGVIRKDLEEVGQQYEDVELGIHYLLAAFRSER